MKEIKPDRLVDKPWGYYIVYDTFEYEDGWQQKIKLLEISPGHSISLQSHFHRDEIWTVINGVGKLTRGLGQNMLHTYMIEIEDNVYICANEMHKIENIGEDPLRILEIQSGSQCDENDIIRYEDSYGRV